MCESFNTQCICGQKTAEFFFGKMVLTESAVTKVFCPNCSPEMEGGWRKMKAPA
jgi:hypothetical protein